MASGESLAHCFASGYGKDQTGQMGRLNFGFMEFIQDKTCKNKLNTIKASPIYQKLKGMKTKLPKSYLCAQGKKMDNVENMAIVLENNGDDGVAMSACEGDTGSPLACMPQWSHELICHFKIVETAAIRKKLLVVGKKISAEPTARKKIDPLCRIGGVFKLLLFSDQKSDLKVKIAVSRCFHI